MGRGGEFSRALFVTVLFVGFIGFLLIEALANGETKAPIATTGNIKYLEGRQRGIPVIVHPNLDPYYVSRRKVPNGPDPIHNRRAGDSTRPPGGA